MDEKATFLTALLSLVSCRASLRLAPGILIRAPFDFRRWGGQGFACALHVGYSPGYRPHSIHPGMDEKEEREADCHRVDPESTPAVFLDNFNNYVTKSNALASCLSEGSLLASALSACSRLSY